jgi:hypothetical protein
MAQDDISSQPIFRKFEIDATECYLQIDDRVTPETVIGKDFEIEKIVTAGCHGRVVAINFNASNHTLIILIQEDG